MRVKQAVWQGIQGQRSAGHELKNGSRKCWWGKQWLGRWPARVDEWAQDDGRLRGGWQEGGTLGCPHAAPASFLNFSISSTSSLLPR